MEIQNNNLIQLVDKYLIEVECFSTMETEPAPSGEWEEYNYGYMIQEEIVNTLESTLEILGFKIDISSIEENTKTITSYKILFNNEIFGELEIIE